MKTIKTFIMFMIAFNTGIYASNDIKLKLHSYYPNNTVDEVYLSRPLHFEYDSKNKYIIIVDTQENCLYIMESNGNIIKKIGRNGAGPGDLGEPNYVSLFGDGKIAVLEAQNRRLQIFNIKGEYVNIIKMFKTYKNICSYNSKIYALPYMMIDNNDKLVDVMNEKGEVEYSFGKPNEYKALSAMLNMANMCGGDNGEIYLAFNFIPVIRKYDSSGNMLYEKRIEDKIYNNNEEYNMGNINRAIKREKVSYKPIFNIIKYFENKVYTIRKNENKLEIVEITDEGKIRNIYYYECEKTPLISDIIVARIDGELMFYLLEVAPDARVWALKM